ncbi:unnamed protein product [Adineta ricciae]|uniref:Uncharacterized protein n=1 Tax=Adineta ricciae TaxID=249248 RepID=A0A816CJ53_ADIRI|nr:unnamed protein product [Adineta ricciae]
MASFLSITILSCKTVSLICLLISIYWYQWFRLDIQTVDRQLLEQLCMSYGAFCDTKDPMPLPRLIVVLPCILLFISLLLETIDVSLLHFSNYHIRSILNFFLEQTCIALSFAVTIHCTWVSAVHIRIAIEIVQIQLNWTFFAFGLVTVLLPIDCLCSIARMMHNCQYEQRNRAKHVHKCRQKSVINSDI